MIIITYSETKGDSIAGRLGRAEYSYYFIYAKYRPVLDRLGTVIPVENPAEDVDRIYDEHGGRDCVFLSFTPPHRTQQDLRCPTVCVFAWEFSSIPAEPWDETGEYNWAGVIERIGNALALSTDSIRVTSQAVSDAVNLAAVPAPVDVVSVDELTGKTLSQTLRLSATLYDSREMLAKQGEEGGAGIAHLPSWNDGTLEINFTDSNADTAQLLSGFYGIEEWGVWSRTGTPQIFLPAVIQGPVIFELELIAHGENIGRDITVSVGEESLEVVLTEQPQTYSLELNVKRGENALRFSNLEVKQAPGRDSRPLGIGLKSMRLSRPATYRKPLVSRVREVFQELTARFAAGAKDSGAEEISELTLEGVAYSSMLNPEDGRKNWEDMVTAFCLAFKDVEGATLLLKMTTNNISTFLGTLELLFATLPPFKCRVVAIHGYLSEEELRSMAQASHFVVNTSLCEGQCLPVMEYMGQGVPAITPDHTAMADYISEENAFVVQSSLQPGFWPFDERKSLCTLRYRIDWASLRDAFSESYSLLKSDLPGYEKMRRRSVESISQVAGHDAVHAKLGAYLRSVLESAET